MKFQQKPQNGNQKVMKTPAKGFGIWHNAQTKTDKRIPQYKSTTCHGYMEDQMVRGRNNRHQKSYTATDQEKIMKKGVWSSFYSRQQM
jgi:hypothetical protein